MMQITPLPGRRVLRRQVTVEEGPVEFAEAQVEVAVNVCVLLDEAVELVASESARGVVAAETV
jgi:hypothetical protein